MLKVTIELVSAITRRTSTIGTMFLSNDGEGTRERGNYDVRVMRKGVTSPLGKATREGRVEDYPRLAYNVWRLIARGLLAAFPEEREPGIARLDAKVMRGLGLLSDHLDNDGHDWTKGTEIEDVEAAQAWLAAGHAEPDDDARVSDALGCNMPEGDAREAFQRSIFRGLKYIATSTDPNMHNHDGHYDDVVSALKFIDALPV